MPQVSVIIPVHNVENYLRECLDSVVNQTLTDIEIICINDGSTDNSLCILEEYERVDKRIKVISQQNQGQSVARNVGLTLVKSDYVVFIDPDDYFNVNALEVMYKKIIKTNDDLVISHCRAFADDINNPIQIEKAKGFEQTLSPKPINSIFITEENFEYFLETLMVAVWGKIFSLKFLNDNKISFINKNVVHEDDGFNTKLLASMPVLSIIDDITVMYRIREKSSTFNLYSKKNKRKHEDDMKIALKDAKEFIIDKYSKNFAKSLIKKIQDSSKYSRFFCFRRAGIKFSWHKYDKNLSIWFIPIFRQKIKNQKNIIKVLGIPLFCKSYQGVSL